MSIDWVGFSRQDYTLVRAKLWPIIVPHLPATGSILQGSVSNILAKAFGGQWAMSQVTTAGGDYNQVKVYRSAFLGEVEKELDDRRLATYGRVHEEWMHLARRPPRIHAGHLLALLEKMGIQLNASHRDELLHFIQFRAAFTESSPPAA